MAQQRSREELGRLTREAELRGDRGRRRADRERRRVEAAERGLQEDRQRDEAAERVLQEARQPAEAAEEQTRLTTLHEYIAACHTSVFSKLVIGTDPNLTSSGSRGLSGPITKPCGKWCPKFLRPWTDFLHRQRLAFGLLCDTLQDESCVFGNRSFLAGVGNRISQRPIADWGCLAYFLHNSVEDPVRVIIEQLKGVEAVIKEFKIADGIVFENRAHNLSDVAPEVIAKEIQSTPQQAPGHRRKLRLLEPGQMCVYRSDNSLPARRTMVYVSEYKAPHKLTAPHLRLGLRALDVHEEVVNRKTVPTPTSIDPDARFQYHAERLTASAITQTYHYMIENGLEYGLLTTGEAIVFLMVDWDEPETLYYHLAEPGPEAAAHPANFHICTAVGQYLAFALMTLGSPGEGRKHGQKEREKAKKNLKTWAEEFETILRSIPEDERSASSDDSPCHQPTTYKDVDRSPYRLRSERGRAAKGQVDEPLLKKDGTPTPMEQKTGQGPRRSERLLAQQLGRAGGEQGPQYCTQKCLLGVVEGAFLDPKCPNVALHSTRPYGYHPVSHEEWFRRLWGQLEQSLDDGIIPLWQSGARGALFKVTMLEYGYTFISKGTLWAFIEDLKHEAAVYERLKPIQGAHVPVFLGSIDLRSMRKTYYYDHRVYIVHMTFLSWGGDMVNQTASNGDAAKTLQDKSILSLRAMHQLGVVHKDVRRANMLLNREVDGVMMIDFERASLLESPRRPFAQLVPNKRRREEPVAGDRKEAANWSSGRGHESGGFSEDIRRAKALFQI